METKTEQLVTEEEMGEVSGGTSSIRNPMPTCSLCGNKSAAMQEHNGMNICTSCQMKHICRRCKTVDMTKDFSRLNKYCDSCS